MDNVKNESSNKQIPTINRNGSLVNRLILIAVFSGFDSVLDKKGKLYFRLLCRLTDKAYSEYSIAKDLIEEEIKERDKILREGKTIAYTFEIIDHMKNCLNAINRVAKTFNSLAKDNSNLLNYLSKETLEEIKKFDVPARKDSVRNRVEHIDEDIQEGRLGGSLFLALDNSYQRIGINNKWITFKDVFSIIETYDKSVLEIFSNLPNKTEEKSLICQPLFHLMRKYCQYCRNKKAG